MTAREVRVPDIDGATDVTVIEVLVKPGDVVQVDDSLVTLESDKATMEIPSTFAGKIKQLLVKVGDKVSVGLSLVVMDVEDDMVADESVEKPSIKSIFVPDIGTSDAVSVIELLVKPGDKVAMEQALFTLESDKATMEVPSPYTGVIEYFDLSVGDKVHTGDLVGAIMAELVQAPESLQKSQQPDHVQSTSSIERSIEPSLEPLNDMSELVIPVADADVYAGPDVRAFAREMGVDLTRVRGTGGKKGRITRADVSAFIRQRLHASSGSSGDVSVDRHDLFSMPKVDFSSFGEIDIKPLTKIKQLTGKFMQRNWFNVVHVTQCDQVDITALEDFRQKYKKEVFAEHGVRLTMLVFVLKAVANALKSFPNVNSSLHNDGKHLICKKYVHIGVAVETPNGLVVPVIRDVDKKSILDLAKELGDLSKQAREKGLRPAQMQGSCFTISSLGGIGGNYFTPIVNAPDVAILGVSKASIQPVYQTDEFVPRLMLPLSLSYDHRVIDGAEGMRYLLAVMQNLLDFARDINLSFLN